MRAHRETVLSIILSVDARLVCTLRILILLTRGGGIKAKDKAPFCCGEGGREGGGFPSVVGTIYSFKLENRCIYIHIVI